MPQIDLGQVVGPPGQDGADGQDGAPGAAAAITGASASATTLSAGSAATAAVTANGTDASRSFVFSFGIPKGDKGDTGAAGPSNITTATETNITGVLAGDGDNVYGVTVDSTPDSSHTNNLITSAGVADALGLKAPKTDLASISITGSTNNTGAAIASGTYFYKDGSLVRAKASIANGATLTLNTNYEAVTAGAINSLLDGIGPKVIASDFNSSGVGYVLYGIGPVRILQLMDYYINSPVNNFIPSGSLPLLSQAISVVSDFNAKITANLVIPQDRSLRLYSISGGTQINGTVRGVCVWIAS